MSFIPLRRSSPAARQLIAISEDQPEDADVVVSSVTATVLLLRRRTTSTSVRTAGPTFFVHGGGFGIYGAHREVWVALQINHGHLFCVYTLTGVNPMHWWSKINDFIFCDRLRFYIS